MAFRRPVALMLFSLLLASPISGCLGAEEEIQEEEAEFLLLVDEMRRGEFHDFIISGETKLTVPPTVLLFVEERLQVSGTIQAEGKDLQGRLLIPPTTMNFSLELNSQTFDYETVEGTPIVSGKDWFEKMEFITSVCSDSSACGGYVNRWMGSPNPNFERAASYFQGHFEGLGYETHLMRVSDHLNPTQPESLNVIAWKRGVRDDCVQGMGSHMDIAPPGGPPGGGTYEGAYDNTAGTVSMMLFARALVDIELECDTFLGLWSSEEEGLRGSNAFANNDCSYCLPTDKELRFYINMDMMGISWPAYKENGDPFPYHAWSGPDNDPEVVEQAITAVMDTVHFDILQAPRNLTADNGYGAGCDQHWDEHSSLTLDVHEDTFGRSDHVTFRNKGAQTIFHLGAYDEDYSAYHSPTDTLDNMVAVVGGQENLENSLEFVMWAAFIELLIADGTPEVRNVG